MIRNTLGTLVTAKSSSITFNKMTLPGSLPVNVGTTVQFVAQCCTVSIVAIEFNAGYKSSEQLNS